MIPIVEESTFAKGAISIERASCVGDLTLQCTPLYDEVIALLFKVGFVTLSFIQVVQRGGAATTAVYYTTVMLSVCI